MTAASYKCPRIASGVFKSTVTVHENDANFPDKGSTRKSILTSISFCVCLCFFLSAAALCDLGGCSTICYSGAFWLSASLYYSPQTSPYSDPGSASFNSEDCPECVSLSGSLCGGGFSYMRSAPLNVSVSSS